MLDFSLYINEFLLVVITMFFATVSPGPDFAFILKQAVTYGKKTSIYTALGIGSAVSIHIFYTIIGIGLIISKSLILFTIVKFLGAGYLIYLGYKSFKSSGFKIDKEKSSEIITIGNKQAFLLGFLCNVLNPKAAFFIISIFTVTISAETPFIVQSIYGLSCILVVSSWYIFLAFVLSQDNIRVFFNKFGKWFDKTVGMILISMGIKVALSK
ncbi:MULTISPECIES: LysE family translocator [Arcobacter]|uniref:Lysine transporter LysE n=1 Tax=Arcobacter ellisii TaxID=913109 RepID=A0A347U8W3_9BACT|nr:MULTISPECIES: LysE family translocator [Arcobacter]AXX95291.1 transporter, LysE family [Arcobacter ellisii]MDY3204384.1 LysE family translocator [Arcobacter sp.]RXI29577.1 lysine transporter LysE [Arcobacter ellisii]